MLGGLFPAVQCRVCSSWLTTTMTACLYLPIKFGQSICVVLDPFTVSYSSCYACSQTPQKRSSYLRHHTLAENCGSSIPFQVLQNCVLSWRRKQNLYLMKRPCGLRPVMFCASLVDVLLARSLGLLLTFIACFYRGSHFRIFETFGLTESEVYLECWRIWNNTINAKLWDHFV